MFKVGQPNVSPKKEEGNKTREVTGNPMARAYTSAVFVLGIHIW